MSPCQPFDVVLSQAGETVIQIPEALLLSTETAKATRVGVVLTLAYRDYVSLAQTWLWPVGKLVAEDAMLAHHPSTLLALHLLDESNNSTSFWARYIGAYARDQTE